MIFAEGTSQDDREEDDDSSPLPPDYAYEGGVLPVPAPISEYPAAVLEVVGDLRVSGPRAQRTVEFLGHRWTLQDIERELNTRRSVLNRADPLFFQVGELTEVFSGSADGDDRAAARTYLEALLDKMAKANEEMRTKASQESDGARFAVAASQYVRRQGGKDWRGLTFELQGLHALADTELRRAAGDDLLYAEGVNRALRRAADVDSVVDAIAGAGLVVLGLLCAPLGAVAAGAVTGLAGLALTVHGFTEAAQQAELYSSVLDPEKLRQWQDVQAAQLSAEIGLLFSVFDAAQVGRAARELVAAIKLLPPAAERAGLAGAAREAFAATRRQALQNLSAEMLQRAVAQAVHELRNVAVLNEVFSRAVTPVIVPWIEEQARQHGTLTPAQRDELAVILADLRKERR
jgi:hypothetical protein